MSRSDVLEILACAAGVVSAWVLLVYGYDFLEWLFR